LGEQDAAHLRAAADEIEVLRKAVVAEREEILELIQSHRINAHLYDGVRGSGLKQLDQRPLNQQQEAHPLWMRGLKHRCA
jgi:hypothetical protein